MIILGLVSIIIIGVVFLVIQKQPAAKNILLIQQYNIIEPYLNKNLNLEESIYFIDLVRKFTLDLIHHIQKSHLAAVDKKIANDLLGLILKIPRMEENDSTNDVLTAIRQISTITETTIEIQLFLIDNLPSLKKQIF